MRVQHEAEKAILWDHVDLCDRFIHQSFPLIYPVSSVVPRHGSSDLPQLVIMVYVAEQAQTEDDHTNFDPLCTAFPVLGRKGAIGRKPAAYTGGVDKLKHDGGEEYEGMYGRYGRVEERSNDGSVDVMRSLYRMAKQLISNAHIVNARRGRLAKRPAMSQLAMGRFDIPF